ncbi:metalloprotease PmbA [Caldichromatium japonicum]|uniref:Metalloprotease PmbA n=1 Tax=Caldichromatium japonicum TaxID=2699430 RepID=A0A6G7V9J5_9GAMM|nr:metalloprotease PmbA [Caldichromatium japonicum]QIK36743.1 metalloprotease PmbA [Caldichromatium japonicum]
MPILTTPETAQELAHLHQVIEDLLQEAQRQGASAAEASVGIRTGLEVRVRLGAVETIEHTRDRGLSVTLYFGHRQGSASTSDVSPAAIRATVAAARAIAQHTQEDPCAQLPPVERLAQKVPDLDLYHSWPLAVDEAIEQARVCEDAALTLDSRIVNSEGASLSLQRHLHVSGNSLGFIGGYPTTRYGLSCAVIAQSGEEMQRDDWWTTARAAGDLVAPEAVGRRAAERALARLGARRLKTCEAPVLFSAEVATGLARHLVSAINGHNLYRHASFLLDHLGQPIFPAWMRIHEQPHLPRGLSSAPYDGEGVATAPKDLVRDGVLATYVLDTYAGCRLGLPTTGNAGGVRNLRIEPTPVRPTGAGVAPAGLDRPALLRELGRGLLVTELIGQGVNLVTGDYSRGAAGFWVENGEIQYPVEEITIAGNLKEMFERLVAVGSDDDIPGSTRTGSWLIERMTIAGEN